MKSLKEILVELPVSEKDAAVIGKLVLVSLLAVSMGAILGTMESCHDCCPGNHNGTTTSPTYTPS